MVHQASAVLGPVAETGGVQIPMCRDLVGVWGYPPGSSLPPLLQERGTGGEVSASQRECASLAGAAAFVENQEAAILVGWKPGITPILPSPMQDEGGPSPRRGVIN